MPEQSIPTAAYYRRVAEQIRAFAQEANQPDVRRELLDLAERFERLALFVEKRYPNRRGFFPPTGDPDDI